ncbi:MAG: chemotaxis protein CheA [Terriglobales bacterium]
MSQSSGAGEMRELFFQSAQELLQTLNEQGLQLEKNPADAAAVREIRRAVHTLKGDSAACGFRELCELAHELEEALSPERPPAQAGLAEAVLSAADMFDAMCAAYQSNLQPPNGDPLRAMIWKIAGHKPASAAPAVELQPAFRWSEYENLAIAESSARGLQVYEIAVALAPNNGMREAGIKLLKNVLQEAGTVLASAPENQKQAQQLEFAVASDRDRRWLAAKCDIPGVVAKYQIRKFEPAQQHDAPALSADEAATETAAASSPAEFKTPANGNGHGKVLDAVVQRVLTGAENTVRVEAERIDTLLNLVGELVIGKSMLHQTLNEFSRRFPKDPLRSKFTDAMAFQSQVLSTLQRSAMKIRMVPVEQLFRRFPRLARDVAKICSKDVTVAITGQETDLDKTLLDALAEPLVHLVRNAVDHGIETCEERRAAGKPAQGTLRLHAFHQGNQVVIEVSDDGRGIDNAVLTAKAVARGLVTLEQAARMADSDITDLIFEPGFSTAEQVTQISGRGVGMDVVRAAVQKLKGTISVETTPGQGTTFRLRLPLTLAIIRAMLFRVAERLYAVPLESVLEITRACEADVHRMDGHEILQLRNEVLTLVRLNRMMPETFNGQSERMFVLVISDTLALANAGPERGAHRKFGLVVDTLVGEEELVIKPLDENVIASDLVSGASILGDGSVVLILNAGEVIRQFARMRMAPGSVAAANEGGALEARA